MLDHYAPIQGPSFAAWMENVEAVGARLVPERILTFHMEE
jgi:hypothetical protein